MLAAPCFACETIVSIRNNICAIEVTFYAENDPFLCLVQHLDP